MLTFPHHTSSRTSGSSTMRLSVGLRPVFLPEYAISAPVDEIVEPFSKRSAASYRNAGLALRWSSETAMPCLSRENAVMAVLYNSGICGARGLRRADHPVDTGVVGVVT